MDSKSLLIPSLSALAGGAVGALLTLSLAGPSTPQPSTAKRVPPAEPAAPDPPELGSRVEALERAVARLNRVAPLLSGPATAASSGAGKATEAERPVIDDPVFEVAVRDLVERMEEERESEREIERSERRRQRSEEWARDLTARLGLTETQKAKVQEIAARFWQGVAELRAGDGGTVSRDERRTRMRELRQKAEADLGQVLDTAQMQGYRELDDDDRLGPRPDRDRRAGVER